jgi:superfamily II DNA/RNA helicase
LFSPTGKSLAFLVPSLHRILTSPEPKTLVIIQPTQDLCDQISRLVHRINQRLTIIPPLSVINISRATSPLTSQARHRMHQHVVIGTPPSVLKYFFECEDATEDEIQRIQTVVVDEFDMAIAGSFKPGARVGYALDKFLAKVRKNADSPQCVLVGATLSSAGTRSIQEFIRHRWKRAQWVCTRDWHHSLDLLKQHFILVEPQTHKQVFINALNDYKVVPSPSNRILVFANTAKSVELACELLATVGVSNAPYHKEIDFDDRMQSLDRFHSGEIQALVCTGLAARGIDFVGVTHVIEFEFAGNVVDHIHRVGRTARIGNAGTSISLYTPTHKELVRHIENLVQNGEELSDTFSRKRSYRRTLNRSSESAQFGANRDSLNSSLEQ